MGYGIQEPNTELVNWLSAYFSQRTEPNFSLGQTISTYLALPGLRGFWPSNGVSDTGQMLDISGNQLHLTNVNDALIGYESSTLIPRAHYNGSTQYHSRSDSAYFDILGTEAYIEQPGLTFGAWVKFDTTASAAEMIVSKWLSAANLSYNLHRRSTGVLRLAVTNDGSTAVNADTADVMASNTQYFVCGRFTPSTELMVQIDDTRVLNTTSIPASIFSGTSTFRLAADGSGSNFMDGKISMSFLCASALSDAIIDNLYMQSRGLFGV